MPASVHLRVSSSCLVYSPSSYFYRTKFPPSLNSSKKSFLGGVRMVFLFTVLQYGTVGTRENLKGGGIKRHIVETMRIDCEHIAPCHFGTSGQSRNTTMDPLFDSQDNKTRTIENGEINYPGGPNKDMGQHCVQQPTSFKSA